MTLKERILEMLYLEQLNPNQFYIKTGLGNGFLDKVGERLKKPSVEKILRAFPKWNIDYLQTGDGEKYTTQNNQSVNDVKNSPMTAVNFSGNHNNFPSISSEKLECILDNCQKIILNQQKQIDSLIETINKLASR